MQFLPMFTLQLHLLLWKKDIINLTSLLIYLCQILRAKSWLNYYILGISSNIENILKKLYTLTICSNFPYKCSLYLLQLYFKYVVLLSLFKIKIYLLLVFVLWQEDESIPCKVNKKLHQSFLIFYSTLKMAYLFYF